MNRLCSKQSLFMFVVVGLLVYAPFRYPGKYEYVQLDDVLSEYKLANYSRNGNHLKPCDYTSVITNNVQVKAEEVHSWHHFENPLEGGEYIPKDCFPLLNAAILVPYRNRMRELDIFLSYMHNFLQRQSIRYRIFIIEQYNDKQFDKGKLLNIGSAEAIKTGYTCLVFHNVDLVPLNTGNLYGCSRKPRHMSSLIDISRFTLPNKNVFKGVISVSSDHLRYTKNISDVIIDWGHPTQTLTTTKPYRFAHEFSMYMTLKHKLGFYSENNVNEFEIKINSQRGQNSSLISHWIKMEKLYTHIIVP